MTASNDIGRIRFGPGSFRIHERGGVNRYFIELQRHFVAWDLDSAIVAGLHRSPLLDEVEGVRGWNVGQLRPDRLRQYITRTVDPLIARCERRRLSDCDVWHSTYYEAPTRTRATSAVTVYDMTHERFPGEMSPRDTTVALKGPACRGADIVFCISMATAVDLHERLGIHEDRIVVTHLGAQRVEPVHRPSPFGDLPFALYVGARAPGYKNWRTLIEAMARTASTLRLLCVGTPPTPAERRALADLGLADRVAFERASDGELAGRYERARGLIYPSKYEGFGLPPIEALLHGCAVVASNAGAIPEVVGGMAHLVDPTLDGLAAGLELLAADGPELTRQRIDGPTFARRYSWESTAQATLAGYRRAIA